MLDSGVPDIALEPDKTVQKVCHPSHTHSNSLPHSIIHPSTPSLTQSPTHPLPHPPTHSLNHPSTHSITQPSTPLPTRPPTHSLNHPPIHSLIHPSSHPLTHPLTQSPTHPFPHPPTHSPIHAHTHSPTPQIKDKFCLDLNEEEAVQHIQALIDESVKAIMAVFVEQIHKWAQVI